MAKTTPFTVLERAGIKHAFLRKRADTADQSNPATHILLIVSQNLSAQQHHQLQAAFSDEHGILTQLITLEHAHREWSPTDLVEFINNSDVI